ncbi:sensor histidine kinase YrkQ [Claveliimonas bilis]|uniref:histidine kinase n=1 Tax=Claveliimonas bilis TaxID=3028070 RepID=A0ABM8I731_9FIRM|nr:sensor histidine kinase YrkQ [Claveliimonas bilis]BDZ76494.1 sensor histidine kinase YrkQ [Claveliimonas bilis]
MTWETNRRNSIYTQLLRLLLIATFGAVVIFFVFDFTGEYVIERYLQETDYIEKKNQEYVDDLQEYVNQEQIATRDTHKLNEWVKKQQLLFIQVYKDDIQVYNSEYPGEEIWEEEITVEGYAWESYYQVNFADGTAEVTITGAYTYQLYNYVIIGELGISFIFFLVFVLLGIRKKIDYIRKLSEEIELLEGGSLEYKITIKGKDELTALAEGLDSMRISFRNLIRQEAEMTQENQRIVTEMSHDLRTPVTSIMLYTEILKQGKYKSKEQLFAYLNKIEQKAKRMKQLTDHLFEYSIIAGEREIELEELEQYEVLFYDLFSDTCSYLEQQGFRVIFQVKWIDGLLRISTDYIMRILDNVTSNIEKYADRSEPVKICSVEEGSMAGFFFENKIRNLEEKPESTGIGIQNIKNMMQKMGGKCIVEEKEGYFRLILLFPCVEK